LSLALALSINNKHCLTFLRVSDLRFISNNNTFLSNLVNDSKITYDESSEIVTSTSGSVQQITSDNNTNTTETISQTTTSQWVNE
jgi:hypothetical protein